MPQFIAFRPYNMNNPLNHVKLLTCDYGEACETTFDPLLSIAAGWGCVGHAPAAFPTTTLPQVPFRFLKMKPPNQCIQGMTHRSPLEGKTIEKVSGVVTAVDGEGFYLQSLTPDQDERTSEAIYIDLQAYVKVIPGDFVQVVDAWVREWNPAGLGANPDDHDACSKNVTVLKQNQPLPAPVGYRTGRQNDPQPGDREPT